MHKRPQDKTECPLYCLNCIYLAKGKKGKGTDSTVKSKRLSVVIVFLLYTKVITGRMDASGDATVWIENAPPLRD